MFLEIPVGVFIFIGVVLFIIASFIGLIILLKYIDKKRIQKMFSNIQELLNRIVIQDRDNSELIKIEYDAKKVQKPAYDFILVTKGVLIPLILINFKFEQSENIYSIFSTEEVSK